MQSKANDREAGRARVWEGHDFSRAGMRSETLRALAPEVCRLSASPISGCSRESYGESRPQALKRARLVAVYGTSELVPFPFRGRAFRCRAIRDGAFRGRAIGSLLFTHSCGTFTS
jgi:hypothetical protein